MKVFRPSRKFRANTPLPLLVSVFAFTVDFVTNEPMTMPLSQSLTVPFWMVTLVKVPVMAMPFSQGRRRHRSCGRSDRG